jgi:hypothetical protein
MQTGTRQGCFNAGWRLSLVLSGAVLVVQSVSAQSFGSTAPASTEAWKRFRAAQPFQTQVVALSKAAAGQPRTLIVSEPSPRLTWARLTTLLGPAVTGCERRDWFVMSGGSVSDVVCSVAGTIQTDWPDRLAQLQLEAQGSTEGAPVVALPVPARRMVAHSLDLRYSANDLHGWLTSNSGRFRSNAIAPEVSLNDILDRGVRGVFWNQDRSLIVWAVDRGGAIDNARSDIRRFSVGGDLLLGALANKMTAVIVARARLEPLAHLPPLRSETVLLLAGSAERELAQSYERNDLIAGRGTDGVDRAPILLSPQLVDTEFGTLLNVADQLLKGWSRAGTIEYVNFNYPEPKSYPFGKVPARSVKPGRSSFLYNWNTDGAAYRQTIGGLDVIVPQRTGSLSVIYGDPRDRPRDLEDVAYDYFAQSGDTTLVRVVQYTLLFQIFRQLDISAAAPAVSPRFGAFAKNVDSATRRQFKYLLGEISEADLRSAMQDYWVKYYAGVPESTLVASGASRAELAQRGTDNAMDIAQLLKRAQQASQGEVSGALAEFAALFRSKAELSPADKQRARAAEQTLRQHLPAEALKLMLENEGSMLKQSGLIQVAMSRLGNWNALSGLNEAPAGWNHTAYVVQSKGTGPLVAAVGGHNIDAPMARFTPDPALQKGVVTVTRASDGGWVINHSPADADRLRAITREVGTRKGLGKEQIEADVARALKERPAEAPVTLGEVRKVAGKTAEFSAVEADLSAHQVQPLTAAEQQTLLGLVSAKQEAIVMEQLPNGSFRLSRTGSSDALQTASVTAATDALANGLIAGAGGRGGVSVLIKGVAEEKAEAMLSFVQASLRRRSKDSVDHVLAGGGDFQLPAERARFINEKIAHNGLRIDRGGVKVSKVNGGPYAGFTKVEVPITVQANTPWYLRIVFLVKDLSAASIEALVNKVASVVLAIKGPVSPAELQAAIRQQLRADLRELNVDSVLLHVDSDATHQVHDVLIGVIKRGAVNAG